MTRPGRWLPLLLAALVTMTGIALVTSAPAEAGTRHHPHHSGSLSYVALGDSYAAGVGAGKYVDDDCRQSRRGYPALLDRRTRADLRDNAACSGATTAAVIADQLGDLNRRTELVTLTVGGNDLGFGATLTACAAGPSVSCQRSIDAALALLAPRPGGASVLGARLASTYAAVATAAPRATILVTGYPYLFEPPAPTDPNAPTIAAINDATAALNATIRSTVRAVARSGVAIRYVDVTAGFAGHGVGSQRPYLHTSGVDAFHPTPRGYRVYAKALARSLPRR